MPSIATQTDISMISPNGYKEWLSTHRDKADDIKDYVSIDIRNINKQSRRSFWDTSIFRKD